MIGTSFAELLLIRTCTLVLRYFALILTSAFALVAVLKPNLYWLLWLIGTPALAEDLFYLLVFLPRKRTLQKPATHPPLLPRFERQILFEKGQEQVSDPEAFLVKWFQNAALEEVKRDNVKEFFCWALLNKAAWGPEDEEELDGYADKIEQSLGRSLDQGRGRAVPLRLTIDPAPVQHRPLAWYAIVWFVDLAVYCYLCASGFSHYRLSTANLLSVFPFRLHTLLSRHVATSPTLSYFHIPHTSTTKLPVLFLHGIGIGLYPYAPFLAALHHASISADDTDDQVGIIAIEVPQISARMSAELPNQQTLCADILAILNRHGWDRFVMVSHSFGSVIAANMLKDHTLGSRISSMVFVDPVTFLLQLPDVAYNFTRRVPRRANELQLHYFASTDLLVANTLARHFFWAENVLWKDDLGDRNVTVALSGRDIVVPTSAVGRYLAADQPLSALRPEEGSPTREHDDIYKTRKWTGHGLDILWFDHCDHAGSFDRSDDYTRLVDVTVSYLQQSQQTR